MDELLRYVIDSAPLPGILAGTFLLILAAMEPGFRLGVARSNKPDFRKEDHVSSMTGAHLGLLAFVLAFSFSLAAGHYDKRKQTILEEAIAIETAYLRADLVAEPHGARIQQLLREYLNARSGLISYDSVARIIDEAEELQLAIWLQVNELNEANNFDVKASLMTQSINSVFELHDKRVANSKYNRIPGSIWIALYAVLVLSMLGMGYFFGINQRRSPTAAISLALSFSVILFLIADLDRPLAGFLQVDKSTLAQLQLRLER